VKETKKLKKYVKIKTVNEKKNKNQIGMQKTPLKLRGFKI